MSGKQMLFPCNCTSYNGGQCYNCINNAHTICEKGCDKKTLILNQRAFKLLPTGLPRNRFKCVHADGATWVCDLCAQLTWIPVLQ